MKNSSDQLNFRLINDRVYNELAVMLISNMRQALPELVNFEEIVLDNNRQISGEEFWRLYVLRTQCKYSYQINGKNGKFYFPIDEFDQILLDLGKNPDVFDLDKAQILCICDIYFDLRILNDLLDSSCSIVRGRTRTNLLNVILSQSIHPKNIIERDPVKQTHAKFFYTKMKEQIDNVKASHSILPSAHIDQFILDSSSGDGSKLARLVLPNLAKCLKVSGPNQKESKFKKYQLLFPLFKLIMRDKKFFTAEEVANRDVGEKHFYEGNYGRYQYHTIRKIIEY